MSDQTPENQYEDFPFNDNSFINVSYLRSPSNYASHWHTYGKFILCIAGGSCIYRILRNLYTERA